MLIIIGSGEQTRTYISSTDTDDLHFIVCIWTSSEIFKEQEFCMFLF